MTIKIFPGNSKLILAEIGLLGPASLFWLSVLVRVSMGSDYFFDVIFQRMAEVWWGNMLLVVGIIFLPGMSIATNGMVYMVNKTSWLKWLIVLAGMFLMVGFFAAVKRA